MQSDDKKVINHNLGVTPTWLDPVGWFAKGGPESNVKCEHMNFASNVNVTRLQDTDNGPITGYTTDITVWCADCGLPFQFVGLPGGSSPNRPTVSVNWCEARMPIQPFSKSIDKGE